MIYDISGIIPYTDCLINQLEMVQRRAACFVKHDYSRHSSVTNMLTDLKWDTLQHKRNAAGISMFYKIKNHLVNIHPSHLLRPTRNSTRSQNDNLNNNYSRSHNQQFIQLHAKKSTYLHSFYPATIVLWNKLPQAVASQPTFERFQATMGGLGSFKRTPPSTSSCF